MKGFGVETFSFLHRFFREEKNGNLLKTRKSFYRLSSAHICEALNFFLTTLISKGMDEVIDIMQNGEYHVHNFWNNSNSGGK